MKSFHYGILFILIINSAYGQEYLMDTMRLVIVSPKVGEIIDRSERDSYHMMSSIQNFVSATFYISHNGKFYSRIESNNDSGNTIFTVQEYPEAVLFRLAEKINNYEDILERRYLMGEGPVTVQVVGGELIAWEPTLPKKAKQKPDQESEREAVTDANFDTHPSDTVHRSEVHFTYGYGMGKGAPPSRSYDETVNYGQNSYRQIANVEDKYLSLGEGVRFEAKYLYFFMEQFAVFFEIGYTYGRLEEKVSYRYVSNGFPSPYDMIEKITFNFYTVPIVAGLHFRLPSNMLSPFGGMGIGVWLPSNQTINFSRESNTIRYEGIQKNEMNTPLGFTSYLGLAINLKPDVDFIIQAKTAMVTYYVQRSEISKYTRNGTDYLQSLSTRDKIMVFEANKNYTENPVNDPDSPRHGGAPYPVPASSVSLVAGLSFAL